MSIKKSVVLFICLFFTYVLLAELDVEQIKSGRYIYGEAEGEVENKKDVRDRALADLSSKISITVESYVESKMQEINGELDESIRTQLSAYSKIALQGVNYKYIESGKKKKKKIQIFAYIRKDAVAKIFEGRKNKAIQYARHADLAVDVNRLGDALKYYYWSLVLTMSHPEKNFILHQNKLLVNYLKFSIETILANTEFEINKTRGEGDFVVLNISAEKDDEDVQNLKILYDDENTWMESEIKDNKGVIYISKEYFDFLDEIPVKIEYKYLMASNQDEDVYLLIDRVQIAFDNIKYISKKEKKSKKSQDVVRVAKKVLNAKVEKQDRDIISEILAGVRDQNLASVRKHFTQQGFDQFDKILKYGDVSLYDGEHEVKMFEYGKNRQIRSIPLIFRIATFKDKKRGFRVIKDNVVLILNDSGKVDWANFTVSDDAFEEVLDKGLSTVGGREKDLQQRMLSLNFAEYYKTLFNLKDVDRISDMFADDAKIFVGYVKRSVPVPKDLKASLDLQQTKENIVYKQMGKREYINRLKQKTFKSPYINIQFDKMEVTNLSDNPENPVYSMQMFQDYYSTYYSDKGYLLLFAEFTDKDNPKIFYRYWAPDVIDNASINELAESYSF